MTSDFIRRLDFAVLLRGSGDDLFLLFSEFQDDFRGTPCRNVYVLQKLAHFLVKSRFLFYKLKLILT